MSIAIMSCCFILIPEKEETMKKLIARNNAECQMAEKKYSEGNGKSKKFDLFNSTAQKDWPSFKVGNKPCIFIFKMRIPVFNKLHK